MKRNKYAMVKNSHQSSWAAQNMYVLGGLVLIFLAIHLINFFWKLKVTGSPLLNEVVVDGETMENAYALVAGLFTAGTLGYVYSGLYILGAILLGFHLSHGFWSAFQTIGWSNDKWRVRLTVIGNLYAIAIALGFAIIPIFLLIFAK